MRSPHFRAVGGVDQIGLNPELVAVLGDSSDQHRAYLQVLTDFLQIVFFAFEPEDRAARHDLHVGQLRERADQTFGQAIAQVFIAGVRGRVHKGQHGDGIHFAGRGFSAHVIGGRCANN